MNRSVELTPAQRKAAEKVLAAIPASAVLALTSRDGIGRTTVLRHIQRVAGGILIGLREFVQLLPEKEPSAIEETVADLLDNALRKHTIVVLDDLQIVHQVADGHSYPRAWMLDLVLTAVLDDVSSRNKKVLFGFDQSYLPGPVLRRAQVVEIEDLAPEDYAQICRAHLSGEVISRLEFSRIHRFAPMLNLWQLTAAAISLSGDLTLNTDGFISYLNEHNITSNVETEEVRKVDLKDLKGMDDVVRVLEAKIALPFENHALASELNLRARRGVLLAGPPGTGKTTIGRALAHRLKGKFFLIDGNAIAGGSDFYDSVQKVFDAAVQNAPSVVFIDDADVIFEGNKDHGLYRYLLTKLDGLESASSDRVCIMMTAMDAGPSPPRCCVQVASNYGWKLAFRTSWRAWRLLPKV